MCQQSSNIPDSQSPPSKSGLRVPFGLRDGALVRPDQVGAGLTCRCKCPGCGAPLIAKAGSSQYRRPHFAHMADAECRSGYETALHLKAKELVAKHARLWRPAWDGDVDMPNPPALRDDDGIMVHGRRVEFPEREASLAEVGLEVRCGDYTPDILAVDEFGDLLIEIRVSHAVDEIKRRRIQSEGRRLIEIDLSRLDDATISDEGRLTHAVLQDLERRTWLSCPDATDAWREAYRDLKSELSRRNLEIARKRDEEMRSERLAREKKAAGEESKRANRERFRAQERAPYQEALEDLPELVSMERIDSLLDAYAERDRKTIDELISGITSPEIRKAAQVVGPNSWIYTVHPAYWQSAAYHHFVVNRAQGTQFNNRDVARWVMQRFGREEALYSLFRAQYAFRSHARAAGFQKRSISFWAFSALENQQVPNFYRPINSFVDRLAYLGVLEHVSGILGEFRVRQQ